jgi:hypothetical protein
MIEMYCQGHHHVKDDLCGDCLELASYANSRLDKCRFGEGKPICANCPVHCYKRDMREKIRTVMRYSGPKMTFRHPILGIRHLLDGFKKVDKEEKQSN